MYVQHVSLKDFRNWERVDFEFAPGVNVLIGANGQGKTNLLEAVGYLATLGSHRVSTDLPLIRSGSDSATVQASVVSDGRQLVLEIDIVAGRANRARLNRASVPRPRDILGGLRCVLFAPEDLAIVRGDPSERRKFLDDVLVQRTPRMAGIRADYERVLKQRTALLKSAGAARRGSGTADLRTLDVWDGHLADFGSQIIIARMDLVQALRPYVAERYAQLAPGRGDLEISYVNSSVSGAGNDSGVIPQVNSVVEAFMAELGRMRSQEVDRGVTLVGPHRDELDLQLSGMALRGYASHGEGWSAALALRLACFELLSADGVEPVLILDDVFAELDITRREQLATFAAKTEQVLISSAVESDVPLQLQGLRFAVGDGQVRRD